MNFLSKPLFTDEYEDIGSFAPEDGATYIYGVTQEQRSEFALALRARTTGVRFIEIRETERFVIETDVDDFTRVSMRRRSILEAFVRSLGDGPIYLDMTGLGHAAWAPLVKVCLETGRSIRVVYLEPHSYARSFASHLGEVYDLSEKIEGIEPIPLFTNLADPDEREVCFVPLLGFEGTRFSYMFEQVQPPARRTIPIIGVPGFQPNYPFKAFLGNAAPIERAGAQRQIQFAKSNCPFSLFYALEALGQRFAGQHMKIGLVGTKPHALGAVLFSLRSSSSVELVYDHVKRKRDRTAGTDRCLVYGVSDFIGADALTVAA